MLAQTKLIVLVLVSWLRCFVRNGMRAKQQGIQSNGSLELKRMLLMRRFFLRLDSSKLKSVFGWKLRWHIEKAIQETIYFTRALLSEQDVSEEMDREISAF